MVLTSVSVCVADLSSRVWIVQEVALAQQNHCVIGHHSLSMAEILAVAAWLSIYHYHEIPGNLYEAPGLINATQIWASRQQMIRHGQVVSQMQTLGLARGLGCYDPRDKVFGMLALLTGLTTDPPPALAPDYNKPVEHIYRDATTHLIIESRSLETLMPIVHNNAEDLAHNMWRSWVPRYDIQWSPTTDPVQFVTVADPSHFGEVDVALLKNTSDPDALMLRGSVIGRMQAICSTPIDVPATSNWDVHLKWLEIIISLLPTCEEAEQRLPRFLVGGLNNRKQPSDPEDRISLEDLRERLKSDTIMDGSGWYRQTPAGMATRYWKAIREATAKRVCFITDNNHLGIAPELTLPGDLAVMLKGNEYPFALRSVGNHFLMLGACYVDGALPWQGVDYDEFRRGVADVPEQVFEIR